LASSINAVDLEYRLGDIETDCRDRLHAWLLQIVGALTAPDRVRVMGIKEVVTAPRSPWQNAYVERLIGSIRRECLDHIIIFNEHHLREVLSRYFQYHHKSRTHLSLDKDCPETRPIHPPTAGKIIAFPQVGGLHHRYERRAA
jgi:hypothetical protein